jgi:hypothetical protein
MSIKHWDVYSMKPVCLVIKYKPADFRDAESNDRCICLPLRGSASFTQSEIFAESLLHICLCSTIFSPKKLIKKSLVPNNNCRNYVKSSINPFTYPSKHLPTYLKPRMQPIFHHILNTVLYEHTSVFLRI